MCSITALFLIGAYQSRSKTRKAGTIASKPTLCDSVPGAMSKDSEQDNMSTVSKQILLLMELRDRKSSKPSAYVRERSDPNDTRDKNATEQSFSELLVILAVKENIALSEVNGCNILCTYVYHGWGSAAGQCGLSHRVK